MEDTIYTKYFTFFDLLWFNPRIWKVLEVLMQNQSRSAILSTEQPIIKFRVSSAVDGHRFDPDRQALDGIRIR
jgi:hypothetical protein